jgi:hypothetical protein
MEGAYVAAEGQASSYRIKFEKTEFLELVQIAKPKIIYKRRNTYFFAFDGFVMYCDKCVDADFSQKILEAIEFSNYSWQK